MVQLKAQLPVVHDSDAVVDGLGGEQHAEVAHDHGVGVPGLHAHAAAHESLGMVDTLRTSNYLRVVKRANPILTFLLLFKY